MDKRIQTVGEYIAQSEAPIRTILKELRALLKSTLPDSIESMELGAPVYSDATGRPLIYLYGGNDYVNLGFPGGAKLDDPDRLLRGNGQSTCVLSIYPGQAIPHIAIRILLQQRKC